MAGAMAIAPTPTQLDAPRRWRWRPATLRLIAEASLVGLVSVTVAAVVLGLWRADLGLPLRYAPVDDAKFYLMLAKGIVDHGTYLVNSSLGAPFGQHLADYPQGADDLNLLIIRGLAGFTSNPALIVNLFFLLTFALTGAAAHLVLRSQGVGAGAAGVVSVLFALLPYHFFRGESHLLLSAYYSVPLAAYLFLTVLAQRSLTARPFRLLAICVVVGSDNLYYAVFAVVLLVGAVLIALVRRHWRAARGGGLALALIVATLGANLAPTFIYQARHGGDPALERSAAQDQSSNEALSLRLTNLILPAPNGRIAPLAHLAAKYDKAIAPGYCEACYASLGTVGAIGLAWLAVGAMGMLAGAGAWYGSRRAFRHAAIGSAIAFGVGTIGGISGLIEVYVTPDIRAWNRISLLIAFFSLLAVGLGLDSLRRWLALRYRHGRELGIAMLLAVLAFGAYDQSSASSAPDYAATGYQEYRSDARFVAEIEARLPPGAAVFQLPYVPFPEGYPDTPCCGPVPTYATKYEPLRGYLHSATLRWSYGAVKGRPANWPAALAGQPLSLVLPAAVVAGFDGLWFDPAGFAPEPARRIEAALSSLLHQTPLLSPDRDLWFFDLRGYGVGLRQSEPPGRLALLRERTLHPIRTVCAPGGVTAFNPAATTIAARLQVRLTGGRVYVRSLRLGPGATFVAVPAAGRVLSATAIDQQLVGLRLVGPRRGQPGEPGQIVVGLTGPGCRG